MTDHSPTLYDHVYVSLEDLRPGVPLEAQRRGLTYVDELGEDESWTTDPGDSNTSRRRRQALGEPANPTHLRVERGWAEEYLKPAPEPEPEEDSGESESHDCPVPGCDYSGDTRAALVSHARVHADDEEE